MFDVFVTPRFERHFRRYNGIDSLVFNKVADLLKKRDANKNNWSWDLEKLKDDSFGTTQVYRIPVTSRDRLVFVIDNRKIILVDVGNHDIMNEYSRLSRSIREADLKLLKVPSLSFIYGINSARNKPKISQNLKQIDVVSILADEVDTEDQRWLYEEELDEEWVQFLDEPQETVVNQIMNALAEDTEDLLVFFVNGGPGTGKTVVLLNLAFRLHESGKSFSFHLNEQVIKYLNRGQRNIPGINLGFGPGVTVLLDDPENIDEFAGAIRRAKSNKCRALIVAFDPLQWHEPKMEEKFQRICENTRYQYFPLWVCYRQSYGVAKKTMELTETIFSKSSRYVDELKILESREDLNPYLDLTLGMGFVDTAGRWKIYTDNVEFNLSIELTRIKNRIDLWRHTHAVCIVYENSLEANWRKRVKNSFFGMNKLEITLDRHQKIRGVEFQELILFLSEDFWNQLTKGQFGLSSGPWEKLTSLHTIFSRAKDSLVIFVVPTKP